MSAWQIANKIPFAGVLLKKDKDLEALDRALKTQR